MGIAIIVPSRGLVFTKTLEFIEKQRREFPDTIKVYFTHDLPIPECFSTPALEAYEDPTTEVFWFIEEDTVPPDNAMEVLLNTLKDADVAAIDYGFNGNWSTIGKSSVNDNILFTGFGCTMIKRHVFDKLERPWFKADRSFNLSINQWTPSDPHQVYGQYDIRFGSDVRRLGFRIKQAEGEASHLEVKEYGKKEVNKGFHIIGEKGRVEKPLLIPIADL